MATHYRKQPDGRSWLVFDKTDDKIRRLAMVRIDAEKPPYVPVIQYLDLKEEEKERVAETALQIAKAYADSKLKVCIMCQTPLVRAYVERLAKACGAEEAVVFRDYDGRSSEEVFESCVKELYWSSVTGEEEWKEVWLAAGKENYPLELFDERIRKGCKAMHFALTQPAFEYWLMLHDGAFDGVLPFDKERVISAEEKEERLARGVYRKTFVCELERTTSAAACRQAFRERFRGTMNPDALTEMLLPNLGLALRRSAKAEAEEGDHLSQMPILVKRLCRLGKRSVEDVLKSLEEVSADVRETAEEAAPGSEVSFAKETENEVPTAPEEPQIESKEQAQPARSEAQLNQTTKPNPDEAIKRLYEFSGTWIKAAPSSLSQEERESVKEAVFAGLDYLGKTYKALENKEPCLTGAMLSDANLLRTGEKNKADACFVEHAKRLRGYLGHFIKKSIKIGGKVCLNTLCELTLCNIWFERDDSNPESAEVAPADVNPDSSDALLETQKQPIGAGDEAAKAPSEADPSLSEKAILASILPEKAKDDTKEDEGPEAEPAAAVPESECRLADDIAVALHYLEHTLKPFVQKKNCTVKPYQLDEMIRSVSLVTEWLADAYELRFSHLPSLPAAAEAAVNRINAHDTVETRRDFVKAVTAFLGTIASLQKQGAFAEEGTLLTARTNAVIVETWLQNVAAEA